MDTCFSYKGHYQTGTMTYISKSKETILGYTTDYFLRGGVDAPRSVVLPDDMLGIVQTIVESTKECQLNFAHGESAKNSKTII